MYVYICINIHIYICFYTYSYIYVRIECRCLYRWSECGSRRSTRRSQQQHTGKKTYTAFSRVHISLLQDSFQRLHWCFVEHFWNVHRSFGVHDIAIQLEEIILHIHDTTLCARTQGSHTYTHSHSTHTGESWGSRCGRLTWMLSQWLRRWCVKCVYRLFGENIGLFWENIGLFEKCSRHVKCALVLFARGDIFIISTFSLWRECRALRYE